MQRPAKLSRHPVCNLFDHQSAYAGFVVLFVSNLFKSLDGQSAFNVCDRGSQFLGDNSMLIRNLPRGQTLIGDGWSLHREATKE